MFGFVRKENLHRPIAGCVLVFGLVLWNEFLVYYFVMLQCGWPQLHVRNEDLNILPSNRPALKVLFLADTHVLGAGAHWLDTLRREWQMRSAFRSAMFLFDPDAVFILGDLMDEGKWSDNIEFDRTVARFRELFPPSSKAAIHVLQGNHDIGFHYMASPQKVERFDKAFRTEPVRLIQMNDIHFVLLNSIAFEGDTCSLCTQTQNQLATIANDLECFMKTGQNCKGESSGFSYSKPIVLQHFPMFREDDSECVGPDSAPDEEKFAKMKPKMDCLSKDATAQILQLLKPRFVVDAHTHHFCQRTLAGNISEWTVASFNWRNKVNPSFLMAVISNNNYEISKCFIPNENSVIWTYILFIPIIFLWSVFPRRTLSNTPTLSKPQSFTRETFKQH